MKYKYMRVYFTHESSYEYILYRFYLLSQLLDDLPSILCQEYPNLAGDMSTALSLVQNIKSQVYAVTAELFNAFENEYSIFCPMTNCFEVFGLDFLVNKDCQGVQLLEVNILFLCAGGSSSSSSSSSSGSSGIDSSSSGGVSGSSCCGGRNSSNSSSSGTSGSSSAVVAVVLEVE